MPRQYTPRVAVTCSECGTEFLLKPSDAEKRRTCSRACRSVRISTQLGLSRSPAYRSWRAMMFRCLDARFKDYPKYGGRGIIVCDRWQTFESFYADMGERPIGTTLDRIDNSGNYEPGNCRWATWKEQERNRSNNHTVTYNGLTLTLAEWAERIGVGVHNLQNRIKRGWSVERMLTTPVQVKFRNRITGTGTHG